MGDGVERSTLRAPAPAALLRDGPTTTESSTGLNARSGLDDGAAPSFVGSLATVLVVLLSKIDQQCGNAGSKRDDDGQVRLRHVDQLEPGKAEHRCEREAQQRVRDRSERRPPTSTPGIDPSSSQPTRRMSTLPAMKCPKPAT